MKFIRIIIFSVLLCFVFPLMASADQLEDAKAAIKSEDFKKAFELLKPLAEENNEEAQTLFGAMYVNGEGVEKDPTKGLAWIMKAARKGFKPARITAFKMCIDLAKAGDTSAMFNVGYMCLNGWGGEQDSGVCMKWLENSGRLGHDKSSRYLAKIYSKGMFGVTPDKEKAKYWSDLPKAFAEGIDGKWKGEVPMGPGGQTMNFSYDFKTDGDKLTGTTVGYGGKQNTIKDGKVDGNKFTFTVESRYNGMKSTVDYNGIFLGDSLSLSFTSKMGRNDASPPVTFIAKRAE